MVATKKIFTNNESGASMIEVILAMAIIALVTPFVYNKITDTTKNIQNIAMAKQIVNLRDDVQNFIRTHQDSWPEQAQIQMDSEDLSAISDIVTAGFIDKYNIKGATVTDVYLAFNIEDSNNLRNSKIAKQIGANAAIVNESGVAYGDMWAVSAPNFNPGDLIYKISRDFTGEDRNNFLHRGSSGDENLNVMMRDLNMNGYDILSIGNMVGISGKSKNSSATFAKSDQVTANTIYFSSGANMNGTKVNIDTIRALGDINGFNQITTNILNGNNFTTSGGIITDKATITNSVNVANDFILKTDSLKTISGFTSISTGTVYTPYIVTNELFFYNNNGLTVSGELFSSDTAPLKIGSWSFPSETPPKFTQITFSNTPIPAEPNNDDFSKLLNDKNWKQN